MPGLPWVLSGIVKDTDNSTAVGSAEVKATNLRTGEKQAAASKSDGSYSFTFTDYADADILLSEAKVIVSGQEVKYGFGTVTVETGLPGKTLDITLDKYADKAAHDIILRKPFQERQDLIYSPQFNALRVLPAGFNKVQTTFARDANNLVVSMEEDDGLHVKVTTFTRDANGYITNIAERIK